MATDDINVCNDFVDYRSPTRRYRSNMNFDELFLYSYKMELAFRTAFNGDQFIIVNGDGAPTSTTGRHQGVLWGCLRGREHAYIPFSQIRNIKTQIDEIVVLDVTQATSQSTPYKNKKGGTSYKVKHFLGETLFKAGRHLYVCGLDRNDNPDKRMFYMCRLPISLKPKTVDEALEGLRPSDVPKGSPRQGEWFFVPSSLKLTPELKKHPIWHETAKKQRGVVTPSTRHVAAEMCFVENAVFVRGAIKDDEHDTLKLGKVWHRVVKSLAVEGWRYVAAKGVRVD